MSRSETFDKVPMGTRQPPESLPVIQYPPREPCFVSGPCARPGPSPAAPAQCTGRGCMPADLSGPAVAVGCGATARRVRGVLERRKRRPVACVSFLGLVFQLGATRILNTPRRSVKRGAPCPLLASFDHGFVSELQQEGIFRYDCDCQKCDIALRAICLRTFGGRSLPSPLGYTHMGLELILRAPVSYTHLTLPTICSV